MTVFLATFGLTFLLVFFALVFFWLKGTPVYRVERENIIRLLELVLSGRAVDNDWQVFLAHPIRHDDQLADIQQRCVEITDREYLGRDGQLFTAAGLAELGDILEELKSPAGEDSAGR